MSLNRTIRALAQTGCSCGGRRWIGIERSWVNDLAFGDGRIRVELKIRHDVAATGDGSAGQTAGHDLRHCCHVWQNAESLLGSARCPAKPGDHFIKDQDRTRLGGEIAYSLQEPWLKRYLAPRRARRLNDDGGNVLDCQPFLEHGNVI